MFKALELDLRGLSPPIGPEMYRSEDPRQILGFKVGSRREELNTPSTDYDSVALTLSYTGEFLGLQRELCGDRFAVPGPKI